MKTQLWACEPTYLENYLTTILNATPAQIEIAASLFGPRPRLDAKTLADPKIQAGLFDEPDDDDEDDIYSEDGEEAILNISGVLSQDGPPWIAKLFGFEGCAYASILDGIAKAEANDNIKTLKLNINSPGGDVQGVDQVWQALRGFSKPTKAVNQGMIASAAYYIASACDSIESATPNAETGSIGCVFSGYDDTDALDQMGVKRVRIYSSNASRKDSNLDTPTQNMPIKRRNKQE